MKRDMDLIRELLLRAEDAGPDGLQDFIQIDGHDQREIAYHVKLMQQAGLVDAHILEADGTGPVAARIFALTWSGHEFLDNVRNETVWKRTRSIVLEKGGAASLEIVRAIAVSVAKAHFELSG